MSSELIALVEGVIMGRVYEQTDRGGTLSFRYDPGWIELEDAFPLFVSMPLTEAPYRQRFIKPYLSNLLPESDGAQVIDRVRALSDMLPDLIVAARDQALNQGLHAHPLREASELMLKNIEGRRDALR